jgi:hypothetical protein
MSFNLIRAPSGRLRPVSGDDPHPGYAVWLISAGLRKGGVVAINAIHLDRIPEFDYDRLLWGERQIRSVANMTHFFCTPHALCRGIPPSAIKPLRI